MRRRTLLVGPAAALAAASMPSAARQYVQGSDIPFDLHTWLDTAPVEAVVQYHLLRLVEARQRERGGDWQASVFPKSGIILLGQQNTTGNRAWVRFDYETP